MGDNCKIHMGIKFSEKMVTAVIWSNNSLGRCCFPILIALILVQQFVVCFELVRYCPKSSACKTFMLFPSKSQAREILHNTTLAFLDFKESKARIISDLGDFRIGEPLPQLERKSWTPDDIVGVELKLLSYLQDPLLFDSKYLGPYVNPSIVLFHGRFLLATSLQWGITMGCKGPQNDMIEFRWINHTDYPFLDTENGQKDIFGVKYNDSNSLSTQIVGQDPRLAIISKDSLLVAFTNHRYHPVRMGVAVLEVSRITRKLFVREDYHLITAPGNAQKNWSPFYHVADKTIYFIQQISNPFRVVTVDQSLDVGSMLYFDRYWSVLSPRIVDEHAATIAWNYGEIRGGTNAVLINHTDSYIHGHKTPCYVAFFHSSKQLVGNVYTTYFFGAYTFTATRPFRLLAASPYPIIDPSMYEGPWAFIQARRIDYVPFPTGLSISEDGKTLYLSLGHQDWRGLITKVNVTQLLASLLPIK